MCFLTWVLFIKIWIITTYFSFFEHTNLDIYTFYIYTYLSVHPFIDGVMFYLVGYPFKEVTHQESNIAFYISF